MLFSEVLSRVVPEVLAHVALAAGPTAAYALMAPHVPVVLCFLPALYSSRADCASLSVDICWHRVHFPAGSLSRAVFSTANYTILVSLWVLTENHSYCFVVVNYHQRVTMINGISTCP